MTIKQSQASSAERKALAAGYERMVSWARLLDRINVFPVADGDTGRNLVISLAPLRREDLTGQRLTRALLMAARGNSGNIAARFMEGLLAGGALNMRVSRGLDLARTAVAEPMPGTMLTLMEALVQGLEEASGGVNEAATGDLVWRMVRAVKGTTGQLPELEQAGVVDAGALGLLLLLDGFLWAVTGAPERALDMEEAFPEMMDFVPGEALAAGAEHGFCVDAVLRAADLDEQGLSALAAMGESAVVLRHGDLVKVHLHTDDRDDLRARLERLGSVVQWRWDDLQEQASRYGSPRPDQAVHLVTDAAGSFTREQADELGVTLLDSYVNLGDDVSVPETYLEPQDLYAAMRRDVEVSTSQASVHERHQHYQRCLALHPRSLYLCVGSAFTGNHQVASDWRRDNDPDGKLAIIDSEAASGKLGICALATARYARQAGSADEVEAFAFSALKRAEEFIYIDQLKYLAAGGRLSRGSAFFGDLLRIKPIVSPTGEGAKKVGKARNFDEQLAHALAQLDQGLSPGGAGALIMLEHTDNAALLADTVLPRVRERFSDAEIWLQPVSLTSGVHMGPGTWAVAFLPAEGA